MTKRTSDKSTVAIQSWLRPRLTEVKANQDYAKLRQQLEAVEGLLRRGHLESMAMEFAVEARKEASARVPMIGISRRRRCMLKRGLMQVMVM